MAQELSVEGDRTGEGVEGDGAGTGRILGAAPQTADDYYGKVVAAAEGLAKELRCGLRVEAQKVGAGGNAQQYEGQVMFKDLLAGDSQADKKTADADSATSPSEGNVVIRWLDANGLETKAVQDAVAAVYRSAEGGVDGKEPGIPTVVFKDPLLYSVTN